MSEAGKPLAARLAEEAREARLRELQPRDAGAALVRTISARERTRTAAAQALAASFEDEAARATAELGDVRAEMIAVRADIQNTDDQQPLGGAFDELEEREVLLHICSFLAPRELGRLACVSRTFGGSNSGTTPGAGLTLVEESARRWVLRRLSAEAESAGQPFSAGREGSSASAESPKGWVWRKWDIIHRAMVLEPIDSFDAMGLSDQLLRGISAYGFEKPSAIQQRIIRPIVSGFHTIAIGCCGGLDMTVAYCVGILQSIRTEDRRTQALMLFPTQELAGSRQRVMMALGCFLTVR